MRTFKNNKSNSGAGSRIRIVMRTANKADFSQVEDDYTAVRSIRSIASAAINKAARKSRSLHLHRVMVRDNSIVRLNETGETAVIATIKYNTPNTYKRGQILHARKK